MTRYLVKVSDPESPHTNPVVYLIPAATERQAEAEARHAWTGLLGSSQEVRDRLDVTVREA